MNLFSRLMGQTKSLTKGLPHSSDLPQLTFEALLPKTPELRSQFIEFVKIVNNSGGTLSSTRFRRRYCYKWSV